MINNCIAQTKRSATAEKKPAFTLAEVLITLGIIGVVAAMTLPTLIQNYQKKQFATAIKKFNSTFSQALMLERAETGTDTFFIPGDGNTYKAYAGEFLKKHFKIAKDCGQELQNCFATSYRNVNKSFFTDRPSLSDSYSIITVDGMSISLAFGDNGQHDYDLGIATVYVDTNGPKNPNVIGYDFFAFHIYKDYFMGGMGNSVAYRFGGCNNITCYSSGSGLYPSNRGYCIGSSWISDTNCYNYLQHNNWEIDY